MRLSFENMRRVMFRLTLCLLLLLPSFSRLAAEDPESLSRKIAADWQALQARTATLTPEERIAAVDEWQKTQRPHLEALRQAQRQVPARKPVPVSRPAPVTELEKIDAAIEKEFHSLHTARLTPEERIRQTDAVLEKTSALREQRRLIQNTQSASQAPLPNTPTVTPTTPEARLAAKTRELLDQTKSLTPEERIAAIDARQPELIALQKEIHTARKAAAARQNPTK